MAYNSKSVDKTSTIEEYINAGAGTPTITWYNYSVLQPKRSTDNKAEFQLEIDNIINDYLDILHDNEEKVELTQAEQLKYYYNPELLAFDIYGTTELDFVILKMNGMVDPKEFDLPKIKLVKKSVLVDLLSNIYNAEGKYLAANRSKYNLQVLTD